MNEEDEERWLQAVKDLESDGIVRFGDGLSENTLLAALDYVESSVVFRLSFE